MFLQLTLIVLRVLFLAGSVFATGLYSFLLYTGVVSSIRELTYYYFWVDVATLCGLVGIVVAQLESFGLSINHIILFPGQLISYGTFAREWLEASGIPVTSIVYYGIIYPAVFFLVLVVLGLILGLTWLKYSYEIRSAFKDIQFVFWRAGLELFSRQGKFRKGFNAFFFGKRECPVCFEKKAKIVFCNPCRNKNHQFCTDCYAQYVLNEARSPGGSAFCCPFGDQDCTFMSCTEILNTFKEFRMNHFQAHLTSLFRLDEFFFIENIKLKVDEAVEKFVLLKLHEMEDSLPCPYEGCSNCVFFRDEDILMAEKFNANAENTTLKNGIKKVGLELGINMREKDIKRMENLVETSPGSKKKRDVDLRILKCHKCDRLSCVVCGKPWSSIHINHFRFSCETYAKKIAKLDKVDLEESETSKFIEIKKKKGLITQCRGCKILIEKWDGDDWCSRRICDRCSSKVYWSKA